MDVYTNGMGAPVQFFQTSEIEPIAFSDAGDSGRLAFIEIRAVVSQSNPGGYVEGAKLRLTSRSAPLLRSSVEVASVDGAGALDVAVFDGLYVSIPDAITTDVRIRISDPPNAVEVAFSADTFPSSHTGNGYASIKARWG